MGKTYDILEYYLPKFTAPTQNVYKTYSVYMSAGTFNRTLTIYNPGNGAYFSYGLHNGGSLVWGLGDVGDESLLWIPKGTTRTFEIPADIVADTFGFKNRNSRSDVTVEIKSEYLSKSKTAAAGYSDMATDTVNLKVSLADEYDNTATYNRGDYCRVGGKLYRCIIAITVAESFTSWKWEQITDVSGIVVPIEKTLYDKDVPWIGGEIVDYSTGKIVTSSSSSRTELLSNIEEVIGGSYAFGTFVYKDGQYIGMLQSDGSITIPTGGTTVLNYINLSGFDSSYSFILGRYNQSTTIDRSNTVEVKLKRFDSVQNANPVDFVLEVGTGKAYTSLRTALEYAAVIANEKRHIIVQFYGNGVEYEVINDITADELTAESTYIGLTVPAYTKLVGAGNYRQNVIILELSDDLPQSVKYRISTINLLENAELENLTVISRNARYAVHDDSQTYNPKWKKKTIKDCRFVSGIANQNRAYGAGYRSGMEWVFINCLFENTDYQSSGYAAFTAHNNHAMSQVSKLTFINCLFQGGYGAGFGSLSRVSMQNYDNAITVISMYGCKVINGTQTFKVSLFAEEGELIETSITGFGNNFDNDDIRIGTTSSMDYSERKMLWGKIAD